MTETQSVAPGSSPGVKNLRGEFPHLKRLASLWANSWSCSTVGGAPIAVVAQCVENQGNVS
ncbi:MAG: hypothetical protein ACYCS7_10100 [Acidimicrobiales bacterium]